MNDVVLLVFEVLKKIILNLKNLLRTYENIVGLIQNMNVQDSTYSTYEYVINGQS